MLDIRRIPILLAVSAAVAAPLATAPIATAAPKPMMVYGTVGPGYTITLKDAKGGKVTKLKANKSYVFVIKDKSATHNFHLMGPGFNKMTTVPEMKTVRWTVKPKAGMWTYVCDPHKTQMKGSFTVS